MATVGPTCNNVTDNRSEAIVKSDTDSAGSLYTLWLASALLAALPAGSFALQYSFSSLDSRLPLLFNHFTVSYIDWVFVPFNFFVVWAVNWRRGGLLLILVALSLLFRS